MNDGVLRAYLPQSVALRMQPAAPNVTEARCIRGDVELSWDIPEASLPVSGYRIYRRDGDAGTHLVGIAPVHRKRFTDRNAVPNQVHHYSIAAVNAAGEGPRSVEAAVLISDSASPR